MYILYMNDSNYLYLLRIQTQIFQFCIFFIKILNYVVSTNELFRENAYDRLDVIASSSDDILDFKICVVTEKGKKVKMNERTFQLLPFIRQPPFA
jgi:hypothetical protein